MDVRVLLHLRYNKQYSPDQAGAIVVMSDYLPPTGSTCLVVGCNRGLGLEITKALANGGIRTFGTSRRPCDELAAIGVTVVGGS